MHKPTICLDFDGVIHSYEKGWQDGSIYGSVVPGFFEWLCKIQPHFHIAILSSRSSDEVSVMRMAGWLEQQFNEWRGAHNPYEPHILNDIEWCTQKPPAWVSIDDRAIQFWGKWTAPELSVETLQKFKPWMQRKD